MITGRYSSFVRLAEQGMLSGSRLVRLATGQEPAELARCSGLRCDGCQRGRVSVLEAASAFGKD